MWHASAKPFAPSLAVAEELARRALEGVGDPQLGEWHEVGNHGVVHLRRRLTADELRLAGNLTVRDIRDTPEERKRLALLAADLPPSLRRAVLGR